MMNNYRTFTLRFLSLLTFLSVRESNACDMCGNFMGITPYDNQGQITFLHRYRVFNGYRSYQQTTRFFVPGAYKIMHDPTMQAGDSITKTESHSSKDFESYKIFELRAKVFLLPRLELNAILPIQQIKTKYDDVRSINTGAGDPSVFAAYHLVKRLEDLKLKQRLILGAGIKLPIGNYSEKDVSGKRLFILDQNGTGSWDYFTYLTYIASMKRIGLSSTSLVKLNTTNSYGECYGNSFSQVLSLFTRLELKKITLYPSVLLNYEYCKGVKVKNNIVPNTNVNVMLLGPSLDIRYNKLVLNVAYQFNAYERVSSQSLANAGRFIVGLTYNFSQNKYLLKHS